MDQEEAVLEYLAAFVQITGTRPAVHPQEALRAIARDFNLNEATLETFRVAPPEDFLVRFPDHPSLSRTLRGDRTVRTPTFTLVIKPWSRLANADLGALSHTVQIELEGIPLHA